MYIVGMILNNNVSLVAIIAGCVGSGPSTLVAIKITGARALGGSMQM